MGIRRIILSTGYMGNMVDAHFGDGHEWEVEIECSQEDEPLGTAGAVRRALGRVHTDQVLVMNGDSFCEFDLNRLMSKHRQEGAVGTLWLTSVEECSRYGSVAIGEDGGIVAFSEKDRDKGSGLINAGIYLLQSDLIASIPDGCAVSLEKETFPPLVGRGLYGVVGEGAFIDIGTPEDYRRADAFPAWSALVR